ncbi:MAG: A24 family peptidase [Methylobacter sp.]
MLISYSILSVCIIIASIQDLAIMKIPNWSSFIIGISGLCGHYVSGEGLAVSGAGLIAGLLLMLPGYVFASMGAGDVKFMAAIGSVTGIDAVFDIAFFSYIEIMVMAILFITIKGDLFKLLLRYKTFISGLFFGVLDYRKPDKTEAANYRLPLAPAIALATCYVLYPQFHNVGDLWR